MIPLKAVVSWGLFAVLLAVVSMYFVGVEQGAASLFSGAGIHELVHDAPTPARGSVPLEALGRETVGRELGRREELAWWASC